MHFSLKPAMGLALVLCCSWFATSQPSSYGQTLPNEWINEIKFRSIGPANMGGRISAIAVYEKDSSIWWAASASGGLIKTSNNGIDFEHQFDDQATVSIGDVQVAQSDPNIVWVGTGEANPRNSVSYGDGVYKSTDGGKTWKNMGLKKTFQTGRIAIHPENPDVVYVGSLGRLWGPNEERGLFKTSDGGKTWDKVLYVDENTGVIDVQMNPKNPDELIVATYERLRDNTDGNDPIKRFGAGSGIYRTRDGGKTFERLTNGLPTCKLGRIGLDYYRKNPKFIYAIVESEKIAKEPENAGFIGLRTEQADVGARITSVTRNGPAEKGGLKEGDIVIDIDGELVPTYESLDNALRRRSAGDKVKLKISRNLEISTVEVTLSKASESSRRRQSPFTGTLGGQIENRQDQQGDEGFEYGGIYMSKDGGDSWTRINSLNPRPMYYSQIRVDPTNNNNIYVLGTSLYRSFDGGKKFTGDGGSDGIHVDHHAMWIDPAYPKHMILGNDGGIHVTYDQMANWDHLNHVAICQFYHVGVDTSPDYKVYGGLQDNGSWGGPNRSPSGSGPVNTDWFRVGGGDGFITMADPTDRDQIYFESQNGGMGRINLRTGERGFIRPQPPRGTSYRFNWKTPFMLSPHNPEIFYSAGNYVFRSVSKGDRIEAISEEITNSNKGAGSAITESPVRQGVLYVGTTCGAVWVTRDGGKTWEAAYSQKLNDEAGDAEESESGGEGGESAPAARAESTEAAEGESVGETTGEARRGGRRGARTGRREAAEAPAADAEGTEKPAETEAKPEMKPATEGKSALTGKWPLEFGDEAPPFLRDMVLNIQLGDDNAVTGTMTTARGETEIEEAKFNPETGELTFQVANRRAAVQYTATVKGDEMSGQITVGDGQFSADFTAKRIDDRNAFDLPLESSVSAPMALTGILMVQEPEAAKKDEVSGSWNASIESDQVPNGRLEFTVEIKVDSEGVVSGRTTSPMGELSIYDGFYNAETRKLTFSTESDDFAADFECEITGNKMEGTVAVADGQVTMPFVATKAAVEAKPAETAADAKAEAPKQEKADAESAKPSEAAPAQQEKMAEAKPADTKQEPAAKVDALSGTWTGNMQNERMPRGMGEFTLELKLDDKNAISGSFNTARGDNEITEGKFNPENKTFEFVCDNGRFQITFDGTVDAGAMSGTISFGEQFSSDFEATREGQPKAAAGNAKTASAESGQPKPLSELLPGPRWVSALEASRYSAARCYVTFDGHRYDDDEPYVFMSEDYGKTWKSIRGNLPTTAGVTRVIREDIVNENVLYLGCEFSAWVSVDRGKSWTQFKGNLPTVAVHEFAQHPTSGDLVLGTHGRAVWIADVTPLRQWTPEAINAPAKLYRPNRVIQWRRGPERGDTGPRSFVGENPSSSAHLFYSLKDNAQQVELTILDIEGKVINRFEDVATTRGLHHIEWNLRPSTRGGRGGGGRGGRGFGGLGPGTYLVKLDVDGQTMTQTLEIERDPTLPSDALGAVLSEEELEALVGEGD